MSVCRSLSLPSKQCMVLAVPCSTLAWAPTVQCDAADHHVILFAKPGSNELPCAAIVCCSGAVVSLCVGACQPHSFVHCSRSSSTVAATAAVITAVAQSHIPAARAVCNRHVRTVTHSTTGKYSTFLHVRHVVAHCCTQLEQAKSSSKHRMGCGVCVWQAGVVPAITLKQSTC